MHTTHHLNRRLTLGALLGAVMLPNQAFAAADGPDGSALTAVIAGAHRSNANRARDGARHPYETLRFFGLAPTQTVVEIAPGAGWYTEILAPYLKNTGRL